MARHVEFINSGQTQLRFTRTESGRFVVSTKTDNRIASISRDVLSQALTTERALIFGAIASLATGSAKFALAAFLVKLIDRKVGRSVDQYIDKGVDWIFDKVKRNATSDDAFGAIAAAECDRVNLWITPRQAQVP